MEKAKKKKYKLTQNTLFDSTIDSNIKPYFALKYVTIFSFLVSHEPKEANQSQIGNEVSQENLILIFSFFIFVCMHGYVPVLFFLHI